MAIASRDLTGKRFGLLTALEIVSTDQRGNLWRCECWCGRPALRYASKLRRSVRTHQAPQCNICLEELNGGRFIDFRNRQKIRLLALWNEHGVLWTELDFVRLEREIRAAWQREDIEAISLDPSDGPEPDLPIVLYDNEGIGSRSQFDLGEVEASLNAMRDEIEKQRDQRRLESRAKTRTSDWVAKGLVALETDEELEIFKHNVRVRLSERIAQNAYRDAGAKQ